MIARWNFRLDLNYRAFEALNNAGKFVLILDGFDELPGLHSEAQVLRAFRELDRLASPRSKIILTCRTHFFKDLQQLDRAHEGSALYESIDGKFGYGLFLLAPFSEQQVLEYLSRWDPDNARAYFDLIQGIYNLQDLARRPVLLNMIAKTVPQLTSQSGGFMHEEVNAATLYELYTRFWLERDDWRSPLSTDERRLIAEAITEDFFLGNRKSAHFRELPELAKQWLPDGVELSEEILEYECRTCNFLVSDREGGFSFAHRSFMEYILASVYSRHLWEGDRDIGLRWSLPFEAYQAATEFPSASSEVQGFVLQQAAVRLRNLTPAAVLLCVEGRPRAESAIARIARELGIRSLGELWADLLREERKIVGQEELARLLLASYGVPASVARLAACVRDVRDLAHFEGVYEALLGEVEPGHVGELAELERRLNEVEDKTKPEKVIAVAEPYVFTRARRASELEAALEGIADPEEKLDARRRFEREWRRLKAEYDQARKRRTRQAFDAEEKAAGEELKTRKRQP